MELAPFRSLVQQHLLPLFSGAKLLRGTSPSPSQRPALRPSQLLATRSWPTTS